MDLQISENEILSNKNQKSADLNSLVLKNPGSQTLTKALRQLGKKIPKSMGKRKKIAVGTKGA